jgi:hypothetical protein
VSTTQVQERPFEAVAYNQPQYQMAQLQQRYGATWAQGDGVYRMINPNARQAGFDPTMGTGSGISNIGNAISSLLQGIWQLSPPGMAANGIQQLWQMFQNWMSQNQNQSAYGDNEQYYTNATGGSNGDPHLSFNGSSWDNMGSQSDLLHSDSIPGGYRVSTQTTPPQANGVTYNQNATVTTNYGGTQVSLDKNGNATISQNGNTFAMQPDASYDLGNGEVATRNTDGSLTITSNNGNGGQITTTMKENGNGVDVNTTANNVDLGGALVNGTNAQPGGARYLQPLAHQQFPHPQPTPAPWE